MNVTLQISDELCKAAEHKAIIEKKSLSDWVVDVLMRELSIPPEEAKLPKSKDEKISLHHLIHDPATGDRDFELPDRKQEKERAVQFS